MRADFGIARRHEPGPSQLARIQRELSGAPPRVASGPQPGCEYLTTQQVAETLHVSTHVVRSLGIPKTKTGYRGSGYFGKRPFLYRRAHVERILTIRRAARISYSAAAAVVIAEIEGRL